MVVLLRNASVLSSIGKIVLMAVVVNLCQVCSAEDFILLQMSEAVQY